eukprot:TRINITY_DN21163_c0_g1_i1.p1 TRINITY_DN21163_c0_g1~~TRINITY_DN21163_c0_g1_i1.p1  ORF type:complete len:449 (-),score=116.57 TRINITY_DN21163_c0_g1_i1:81-1427(-)
MHHHQYIVSLLVWLHFSVLLLHGANALQYCGKKPLQTADLPANTILKNGVYEQQEEQSFEIPAPPAAELGYELAQVFAFLRHGDRNVCDRGTCWSREAEQLNKCREGDISLPSSKKQAREFFKRLLHDGATGNEKCAIGQLTTYGFKQHIRNGRILRRAYDGFISRDFDHSELFVRSTDYSRTISSAQALLMGMFDDFSSLSMHFEHLLDIQVENKTHGIIQPNYRLFPILHQYDTEALEGLSKNAFTNSLRSDLLQALDKISGEVGKKLHVENFTEFFDCLNVNFCHGRTIPVTPELLHYLNRITPWKYQVMLSNPTPVEYGKYSVGPLLAAMRNEMLVRISGEQQQAAKKMYITLGHDTGPMMPLLSALQIWDSRWPSYASEIVFELYENKLANVSGGSFAVRVIYDGQEMHVPGCSEILCDWKEFNQVLQLLMPPAHERYHLTVV